MICVLDACMAGGHRTRTWRYQSILLAEEMMLCDVLYLLVEVLRNALDEVS